MKFQSEKKQSIVLYILEKIAAGADGVSRSVAEAFGISTNTVHSYLNELLENRVIQKVKRGRYELVTEKFIYPLRRSEGHLDSDTYAMKHCLAPHITALAPNIQQIWDHVFTEMTNNVIDHSGAENMLVMVKTNYLYTQAGLADDGVGIFEKIRSHFGLSTLDDAVCELFKGKLTTDSDHHSGEGIFFSSRMMDRFTIVSDGKIFTTDKYSDDMVADWTEWSEGTCVVMSLSNFTGRTAQEVFDEYSSVDGGFSQTRIPLKNIFDTSPVSRSQAKRIANRLEHFQTVELDFEGLDWMGQGFAHQLFVVFQNEHPETRLSPINMCESVENMYRHVLHS